ncbi:MAG: LptF/LptG family permease [Planctomycetia bacterium]|nr:LptF/LptG family permease [Planctomycetia bacterium]
MPSFPYFTIIDRYFIRSLLLTTLMCLISVVGIMLLFDILQRADAIPDLFKTHSWGALEILGKYYLIRVLWILQTAGIYLIVSGLTITFYRMERNTTATTRGGEVIPMMTSGFSRLRVAVPFFYTSIFLVLCLFVLVEGFFPNCTDWPGSNSSSYTPEKSVNIAKRIDTSTRIKISGDRLNLESGQIVRPRLELPLSMTGALIDDITAELAQWVAATEEHPGGYLLFGVEDLDKKSWIAPVTSVEPWKTQKIFPAANLTWVPEGGDLFVVSQLQPEFLQNRVQMFVPVSLWEIYRKLHEPSKNFQLDLRVELHSRLLKPLLNISLIFLTVPIILSARFRSKLVIALLLGMAVLVFQVVPAFCIGMGERGMVSPYFAAWLPLFVFYTLDAFLFEELYT